MGNNTKESTETQAAAEVLSDHDKDNGQTVEVQPASTRPVREIRVPARYGLAYSQAAEVPWGTRQLQKGNGVSRKRRWQTTMQDDANSLNDN